jgi:serine/threonine protein kinase
MSAPVNDGERMVLRRLRDDLDESWFVLGNFEFPSGHRWPECDALAICSGGWAYLIETKHWVGGSITGNDHEWLLPSLSGSGVYSVQSPVHLVSTKAKKLASYLKNRVPGISKMLIHPLVVLVTEDEPNLTGKSAQMTVTIGGLLDRLHEDPRVQQAQHSVDAEVAPAILDLLTAESRELRPSRNLGPYTLLNMLDTSERAEVWEASITANPGSRVRVKRYFMDPLLAGEERQRQAVMVRRDLDALTLLSKDDNVVPVVGYADEIDNSFVVATQWPPGRVLSALIAEGELKEDSAEELVAQLFRTVAAVHGQKIVHRNITPDSLYVANGRVYITDFDYARIEGRAGVTAVIAPDILDMSYAAPEVLADLGAASAKSDLFSAATVCRQILGAVTEGGKLSAMIEAELRRCCAKDPKERPADAVEVWGAMSMSDGVTLALGDLAVHDVVDNRFVIRQHVNDGGTAVVFKVFDRKTQKTYAAKFVRPELAEYVNVYDEYNRLEVLRGTQNVVVPGFALDSSTVERAGHQMALRSSFLLTAWISGTSLADLIGTDIPVARALQIGSAVAAALAQVHNAGIVHRDVKPENIVLDEGGSPVLIDFNISATIDSSLTTRVGTPAYLAPEMAQPGGQWTEAADVYALGVCLGELVAGRRLGAGAAEWCDEWETADRSGLRTTLRQMLHQDPGARPSAAEASRMLDEALSLFSSTQAVSKPAVPPAFAAEGPDHNPYLDRLIGLFSQSSGSNAGTRGLDEFRHWLYVETMIDRELRPAVLSGGLRLVVITGNAGDGKTAFIRMIEEELKARGAVDSHKAAGNGAELVHEGTRFVTNWDGSQDEDATANDDVLIEFFAPFEGESPSAPDDLVSIIAINEGRLLDFLAENRDRFGWLERELLDVLRGGGSDLPWLAVVNLNLRALTIAATDRPSIVSELLVRMSDERLWQACKGCALADRCYAPANAAAIRHPVVGSRAVERIRQALDLVRLRRRLHITMRDLVSALAYTVAGNRTCSEIHSLYDSARVDEILSAFSYNAMFAARDEDIVDSRGASRDRLLAQLASLDVAVRPLPEEDSKLWLRGPEAIPEFAPDIARPDRALLEHIWTNARASGRDSGQWAGLRLAHGSLRRKHYLEREDPGHLDMFPYEHLQGFLSALVEPPPDGVQRIAEAIGHSEGLRSSAARGVLAVRMVQDLGARDRSFVVHRSDMFDLTVVGTGGAATYVENQPDRIRFAHRRDLLLSLDIDVDLWEALMRIGSGFTPSREDLRGSWISLQTFKQQVASMPSQELRVQSSSGALSRVYVDEDGRIVAEAAS